MAYSTQRAVSDGSLVALDLAIGYQSRNDIKVFINDLPAPPGRWAWVGTTDKRISFNPVVPAGQEVLVQRSTRLDRIINVFARGAKFNNTTLDMNFEQALYLAQEAIEGSALSDIYNDVDFHGFRLKNVAPAVDDNDLVPFGQLKNMNTGAYEARNEAVASAAASQASAVNADASRANAALQATTAGQFAQQAQVSAVNADGSRAASQTARAGAEAARDAAQAAAAPATAIYSRLTTVEGNANDAKTQAATAVASLGKRVSHANTSLDITWVSGDGLRVRVDATDFGSKWPISVSGRADSAVYATSAGSAGTASTANYATSAGSANTASSASYATNAGYADNTNNLAGVSYTNYVRNASPGNVISWAWDGVQVVPRVDGTVQFGYTEWSRVLNRPTDLASFSNSPRYVQRYGTFGMVDVAAPDGQQVYGRAIPSADNRIAYLSVISGGIGVSVDGQAYSWPINPSDERLKEDIHDSTEDALAKVRALVFKGFRYNVVSPMMEGIVRKDGLIAQHTEGIDSEFVTYHGDFRQLNNDTLLIAALHAIQQLDAEVQRLKAKE